MIDTRCLTIAATFVFAAPGSTMALDLPMASGPFRADMESLKAYRCPDWFRDAKFGIWAHWGPQAVPEMGDWYAKNMYVPGGSRGQYEHHLKTYGHPSEFGYKDIIPLWKAEKWDPERLMALYQAAGARYFVSMGSHHDNFYLWNSALHKWNSVNMGPKRDVVGDWQKAARKFGLKFGVSEHLGASFTWFQASHGADREGPKTGVPYDGADPRWQDLYHPAAAPGDTGWYSNNPAWHQQWYGRIKELVDNYQPDLLYSDGPVPFGNEVGLSMIAHLYNGNPQAVYNCKQMQAEGRWVEDLERGVMGGIQPFPWQTDTSIGDWFYNRNWKFRPVSWTIHMLCDIVSKNGNLLLNIVQRPDGSLDAEVEQQLAALAKWFQVHGEAIHDTRPWLVYGEGPVRSKGGQFKEDFKYGAKDIRFTTKRGVLYAMALGWPADRKLLVKSLAEPAGKVTQVNLLGSSANLDWKQTADGLLVTLPAEAVSEYTAALKIVGESLKPAAIADEAVIVRADPKGCCQLDADAAELHGSKIGTETKGDVPNIGFWDDAAEWVSWRVQFDKPGRYRVELEVAAIAAGVEVTVESGASKLVAAIPKTGGWDDFKRCAAGQLEVKQAGVQRLSVRPADPAKWQAVNLRAVRLSLSE